MTYTVNSFFAGIGGFDLAFEAAGFAITLQVEIDDYCNRVLSRHWPDVPKIADIRDATAQNVPYADVFCGGFPCQDISLAGNRAGIHAGTRSGLWFELARVIGEVRPRVVLLENVAAITTTGGGGVGVIADLAAMGYDARWGIIRASDAGAPHQRARWFCMADATAQRLQATDETGQPTHSAQASGGVVDGPVRRGDVANTKYGGQQGGKQDREGANAIVPPSRTNRRSETQPGLGRNTDGLSYRLDRPRWPAPPGPQYEWEPPRTTDQTTHRTARLKALGNAVVPQVVYPLAVMIHEWLDREAVP